MRTTVNIDEDVLLAVKVRAARERRTLGAVLSELARQALTARTTESAGTDLYGFRPLPARGRPVSNTVINQLREDDQE